MPECGLAVKRKGADGRNGTDEPVDAYCGADLSGDSGRQLKLLCVCARRKLKNNYIYV